MVCGDFNVCPYFNRSEFTFLAEALRPLDELFPEVKLTHREGGALDHVFVGRMDGRHGDVKKAVEKKEVVDLRTDQPGLPMSDHMGLAWTLNLNLV